MKTTERRVVLGHVRAPHRAAGALLAASLALGTVAVTPRVRAEASELDKANARKLFNEGLDLRKAGDGAGALAKFEATDALYPTPRGRLELGRQRVLLGQLVEGWTTLSSVAQVKVDPKDEPKYAPHRAEAQKLATEVEARIPTLRVEVVHGPGAVTVDGVAIPSAALSQPRLLNPGKHVVVVRSEAGVERRAEVLLAEGESKTVKLELPAAEVPGPTAPPPKSFHDAPPGPPGPGGPTPAKPPPDAPAGDGELGTQRTLALVAGGVGVVGLILGSWAGLSARSFRDQSAPYCTLPNNGCSDPRGVDLREKAFARADLSTVSFLVAGVALTGGIVLWLTDGPRAAKPAKTGGGGGRPSVGLLAAPAPAGWSLGVTGHF